MALSDTLRSLAAQLVNDYGEPGVFSRENLTDVPATGAVTVGAATEVSLKCVMVRRGKAAEHDGQSAVVRQFYSGGRVLAGDEEIMVAALTLGTEPRASDVWNFGATVTADGRRRVVDVEVVRVQGADIVYLMGLEQ